MIDMYFPSDLIPVQASKLIYCLGACVPEGELDRLFEFLKG
jgi:hypothetical protein